MRLTGWLCACAWLCALSIASRADDALPKSPSDAAKLEASDMLPLTSLYEAPIDLTKTKPGDLLKKEAFAGYALPPGASAVRILYHSRDSEGHDVATSGVVLIPAGKAPPGGWPVIAWAHGTSGVARICAPSAMKDVYYGSEGLMPMVAAHYAVVATDYHGLGTVGAHEYLDAGAQANDVIYSIPAARMAVPALGRRWVIDGHSQGGIAAWAVATRELALKDPYYLGAVSVAGAANHRDVTRSLAQTKDAGFYLPFIAFGIHARFPAFRPAAMLTPAAMARYDDVTTKGCWLYSYAVYANTAAAAMTQPRWLDDPWVRRFFAQPDPGSAPIRGAILAIGGEADRTVPIQQVRMTVARACKNGIAVDFRSYPGLDHDPVMEKSTPDQLAWIADRFAGKAARSRCPEPI